MTNTSEDWKKRDAWLETRSGRRIHLLKPDPNEIHIDDIAHGLSLSCRWSGQCDDYFSIAQHSMGAAKLVPHAFKLSALMHDAAEAYLTDIPTPAKRIMPEYQEMEHVLWLAIAERFGLPVELDPEVHKADRIMLMSERDILKPNTRGGWGPAYEESPRDHGVVIHQLAWNETWQQAKAHFLEDFFAYGGKE